MRLNGFLRKPVASAILALLPATADLALFAEDLPPSPVPASKSSLDNLVAARRPRVYCPPVAPQYCPPVTTQPCPPAPVPAVSPSDTDSANKPEAPKDDTNRLTTPDQSLMNNQAQNQQNQQQQQQQNTAPNLAGTSNARFAPNFIGDMGPTVEQYVIITTPYIDPNSSSVTPTPTYADLVVTGLDPYTNKYDYYFRAIQAASSGGHYVATGTTSTIFQHTPQTFVAPLAKGTPLIAVTNLNAQNGAGVQGNYNNLQSLTGVAPLSSHLVAIGQFYQPPWGAGSVPDTFHDHTPPGTGFVTFLDAKGNPYDSLFVMYNSVTAPVIAPSSERQKLADNASPIPRDRVYINYNYFDQVPNLIGHSNVNRITPGFEKTFFNAMTSVEVRLPINSQISNNIDLSNPGSIDLSRAQFGDVTTYLKGLIYVSPTMAISTGTGIQLPTAGDVTVNATATPGSPSAPIYHLQNNSVHLLPFLAGTYTPNTRFYAQGILQFDMDANGNRAYGARYQFQDPANGNLNVVPGALNYLGTVQDQSFMYASLGSGYYIYRDLDPYETGLTGIAPTAEVHYNFATQKSDTVADAYGNKLAPVQNVENVNGVLGVNAIWGHNKFLTVAYSSPLGRYDNQFNYELRVMFNYYFGSARTQGLNMVPGR